MSIQDQIKRRLEDGQLVRRIPMLRAQPEKRIIYVSTVQLDDAPLPLQAMLDGPPGLSTAERVRWANAAQFLDAFIERPRITIPPDSRRGGRAVMSRLDYPEDEVWDIRCYDPRPGMRIFGRFAEKDIFVALAWGYKETLETDWEYGHAKHLCFQTWSILFDPYKPFTGQEYPNDYITGAFLSTDS